MKDDSGIKSRQQIIEKIKATNNILVTVSRDPSVDELSAALGLTTILNKIGKHGTVIFSGEIPSAINFLDPEKLFERTTDSLRDFIIALDKEKADHLRYKIDGDVVKIFITPYHATITENDLNYSQGDYNVELVIALGVSNREHLDAAISAHGQMLHDADIVTLSAGKQSSKLGRVDWQDGNASCLCEMVANIGEALKADKPILDKQIATTLLTGIVAATDRFSNIYTSSRVMTVAAQLMASGANQQLIAARLQESHEIDRLADLPKDVVVVEAPKPDTPVVENEPKVEEEVSSGGLTIEHDSIDVSGKTEENAEQDIYSSVIGIEPVSPPTSMFQQEPKNISLPSIETIENELTEKEPTVTAPSDELKVEPNTKPEVQPSVDDEKSKIEAIRQTFLDSRQVDSPDKNISTVASSENKISKPLLTHTYLNDEKNDNQDTVDDSNVSVDSSDDRSSYISTTPQAIVQPPIPDLPMPPAVPNFSTLPPQPEIQIQPGAPVFGQPLMNVQPSQVNNDPAQFKIPGQQ